MPVSGSFPNLSSRVPPPRPVHGASSETDAPSLEPPFIHLSKSLVDEPSSRFPKQDPHGKRGGASLCEGFHVGDLEGGLLYWGPRKIEQGSEMGVCFCGGPAFGECGGGTSFLGPSYLEEFL